MAGQAESGASAIAVPIGVEGRVLAALSIVAPTFRYFPEAIRSWGALLIKESVEVLTRGAWSVCRIAAAATVRSVSGVR